MGEIESAKDTKLDREVAIKVLTPSTLAQAVLLNYPLCR
jgi:hypothetical protein